MATTFRLPDLNQTHIQEMNKILNSANSSEDVKKIAGTLIHLQESLQSMKDYLICHLGPGDCELTGPSSSFDRD